MVHDHGGMGREVNLESARVRVLEQEVMVRLGCDLDDGGRGLRGGEDSNANRNDRTGVVSSAEF